MVDKWVSVWADRYPWPSEAELVALAVKICAENGKPAPEIVFKDVTTAECQYQKKRIRIPRLEWIIEHRALGHPLLFRALMLHELSHWLIGPTSQHGPRFYETYFRLCEENGVPIELAFEDEFSYKPRSAPRGLRAYLRSRRGQLAGGQPA